jgi:hypothetical protein
MYNIRYSLPNGTLQWYDQRAVPRTGEHVELPDGKLYIVHEVRYRPATDVVFIHLAYAS